MAKPAVTLKSVKGTPLSTVELDENFDNLRNSTVTLRADTTDVVSDLNGTINLVAGDNVTITGNNTTKTVTISSQGGAGDGFTGSVGFTGSRGFTGSVGFTGSQGFIGSRGFTGSQGSITVQNDNASNAGRFILFTDVSSGTKSTFNVSDSKITFNPFTGRLSTTELTSNFTGYREKIFSLGNVSGIVSPDVVNGNIQTITLVGNITINGLNNVQAGQSVTLIINTNGTNRTLTSNMKFAGGVNTISTSNTIDVLHIFFDGTNYLASLIKGYI
jgi:hypothetical protein